MTDMPTNAPTIRRARIEDLPRLMQFIETEWKTDHIFATNIDFFKYQYQSGDMLNFIISENSAARINGILGFIPSSSANDYDVWTSIWKVSRDNGNPILGIQLLQHLKASLQGSMMCLGINEETIPIYRYLGFSTSTMNHHFLPNRNIEKFQIGKIPLEIGKIIHSFKICNTIKLRLVTLEEVLINFEKIKISLTKPKKDLNYIQRRYFTHPIFSYCIYGAFNESNLECLVIARIVKVETAVVLRVVDIIGNESVFPWITHYLYDVIVGEKIEYLDLVSYGMDDSLLQQACLIKVNLEEDHIVIPNYFDPFKQINVKLKFFVDGEIRSNLRLFKADGDQDRPS